MSDLQDELLLEFKAITSTISNTLDDHNLRLISFENYAKIIASREQLAFIKGQMAALKDAADNIKL